MRVRLTTLRAVRDATLATALVLAAVWAGSGGFAGVDRALVGYLAATLVACFCTVLRASLTVSSILIRSSFAADTPHALNCRTRSSSRTGS